LGIGAGIVIPLSTGLVAEYFAGRYRTQQLGISSAINNLSLVVATYLTGWLADINWHVPFAVYLLPIVSIILCRFLPKASSYTGNEDKSTTGTPANTNGITSKLAGLMVLYFFVTYSVLAIPLNLPFVMEQYKMDSNSSGAVIAIFFLAITLPGFFINKLLDKMGRAVNWINLLLIAIGLIVIYVSHHVVLLIIGSVLIGFGYGIIQPLIYDKTSLISTSGNVVMSLALVMSMNYLAVLISPFIIKLLGSIFATTSPDLIFIVNGMMVIVSAAIAMAKRKGFVLGK
jgi:MFS family permease